jgi:predicted ATP-grasp superfamily ATP-dependent carboligase
LAISLNKQSVQLVTPEAASSYEGGAVPFDHPLKREAFKMAEKAAGSLAGLRGYVGVDLVLAEGKPFVVDVNPRLTTSYVGVSRVAGFNVAEAMVNAVLKNKLPARRESNGFVYFSKVGTSKPTVSAFQKAARINGVISPPFTLDDNSKATSIVAGHGESLEDARLRFEEAKKRLLNIISGG